MTKAGRWFRKFYRINCTIFGKEHADRIKPRLKKRAKSVSRGYRFGGRSFKR